MCKDNSFDGIVKNRSKKKASLDTLAIPTHKLGKHDNLYSLENRESFIKRQKAKAITLGQLFPLIDLNSPLNKSYWNTYHCNKILRYEDGKITSEYCNARWCTVCNRIRTAKMINGYSTPLMNLKSLHFMTLTSKNVNADLLDKEVFTFLETWKKIRKHIRKYRKDIELKGIRKLEITYNPKTGFNPHFHFLIDGENTGNIIINLWLKHNKKAKDKGQDIRKAKDGSLLELFKYAAKGIYKGKYYPKALDKIYQALYYKKTYYPFGIKKYVSEDIEGIRSQKVDFINGESRIFEWNNEIKEWIDESGVSLTSHALEGDLFDWIESLENT